MLAEDVNLRLALQNIFPVHNGAYRLLETACEAALAELLKQQAALVTMATSAARTAKMTTTTTLGNAPQKTVRIRLHGSPSSVASACSQWFQEASQQHNVETVAADFDWIVSVLYTTSTGTYHVGVEQVPDQEITVGPIVAIGSRGMPCHCTLNRRAANTHTKNNTLCCTRNNERTGAAGVSKNYLRHAFLRRLWDSQETVCSQSHRKKQMPASTSIRTGTLVRRTGTALHSPKTSLIDGPLEIPICLLSAVSRAYWKLTEVLCVTPVWRWACAAASRQHQKAPRQHHHRQGAVPTVVALDLGAAPGGWSYQVGTAESICVYSVVPIVLSIR